MLTRIWNVGSKVRNLDRELEFHKQLGHEVVLDERVSLEDREHRVALVRARDKYLHLSEEYPYESDLDEPLEIGVVHIVSISDAFDEDVEKATAAGFRLIRPVTPIAAQFGRRRVAFLRSPGGYLLELIDVIENLVPEV